MLNKLIQRMKQFKTVNFMWSGNFIAVGHTTLVKTTYVSCFGSIAQLVRAPLCHSGGLEFKSQ